MVHNNFKNKVEFERTEFKALMHVLYDIGQHAEEGRKLLCLVDQIIDFYILRHVESDDDIKMPIIYLPICEEWAQILCEEFVTLKMSLLWGHETRIGLLTSYRCKPHLSLPAGASKKEQEALRRQYRFIGSVAKYMTDDINGYVTKENEKCFIYSRYVSNEYRLTAKTKGHYHFCHDLVGTSISSKQSLILLEDDETKVYESVAENDGKIKIPNIFLFLQKDMDGHNTSLGMQMQRPTIFEYNQDYDAGIKNVFFFVFSQKPYRLHRIFENKCNLVERIQREKISETHDFISFTKEEMNYLFKRDEVNTNALELKIEDDSDQKQIKMAFDLILQDLPHEVKLRNEIAICFTEQSVLKVEEDILKLNPEADEHYVNYFFQLLSKIHIKYFDNLRSWIANQKIAVVLDYNVDQFYKNQLELFLKSECWVTSVNFYTFRNFKAIKQENSILESKILVLSMLNHCTGYNWAIYPNSFDQYHLNPGQSVLQINNRIVFDPRFSWYQYRYAEQQKFLLESDYRKEYLKCTITIPEKPVFAGLEPKDDQDEQNGSGRMVGREQRRVVVSFGERQHRTLDEDELVIYQYMGNNYIRSISDIQRDFDDVTKLMIQPLQDFYQPLEYILDTVERKMGDGESIVRNNPKYGLTDKEKSSKREMWKILLEHRVAELGEESVYKEIMSPLLPIEKIQFGSFKRWLDSSESSILPRSRRMQKRVIEEYLQIEELYTRLLRHRKSRITTNTEDRNSIFRTFLSHCLLEDDAQKSYNCLNTEVCDYLNIANADDVKAIIDIVKEEKLNLRPIKSIKYD